MCTGGAVDAEVVGVREGLGVHVPVFGMVGDVAAQHRGDRTVEALNLAVCLRVVRRREGVRNAQDPESVLVQLAGKLRSIVREDLLRCAVLEHPVRCEGFCDVETGGAL